MLQRRPFLGDVLSRSSSGFRESCDPPGKIRLETYFFTSFKKIKNEIHSGAFRGSTKNCTHNVFVTLIRGVSVIRPSTKFACRRGLALEGPGLAPAVRGKKAAVRSVVCSFGTDVCRLANPATPQLRFPHFHDCSEWRAHSAPFPCSAATIFGFDSASLANTNLVLHFDWTVDRSTWSHVHLTERIEVSRSRVNPSVPCNPIQGEVLRNPAAHEPNPSQRQEPESKGAAVQTANLR